MPLDEDDRRLGNVDLMADESQLENTTPLKRSRTSLQIAGMMSVKPTEGTTIHDMDIDTYYDPEPSASAPQIVDESMPEASRRGICKRAQRKNTGLHRTSGARNRDEHSADPSGYAKIGHFRVS